MGLRFRGNELAGGRDAEGRLDDRHDVLAAVVILERDVQRHEAGGVGERHEGPQGLFAPARAASAHLVRHGG